MTLLEETRPAEVFASAARTTTATSSALDRQNFGRATEWLFLVSSAAGTGTTPTLNIKVQHSEDNSSWSDVSGGAFTQITTVASFQEKQIKNVGRYVRAVATIAGTTPSFNFCVIAIAGEALDEGI